jgi:PhnB protein
MAVRLNPYLITEGNAKEAIQFYEKALGAVLVFTQTFGEMPANPEFPLPEEAKDLVAHALLKVGDTELMFSDSFPGQPVQKGDNVTVCVTTDDVARSQEIFAALADGGQVCMPFQATFWSPGYGMVTDKYGVTFHVSTAGEK